MSRRNRWIAVGSVALLALLVAGLLGLAQALPGKSDPAPRARGRLKVLTANIRLPMPQDKGERSWEARRDVLAAVLHSEQPDILGTQETSPAQLAFLVQTLQGYGYVPQDTSNEGMFGALVDLVSALNTVFYRKDRFELLDSAHGPLRPADLQANPSENAFYTLAVLRDKSGAFGELIVVSTQLRHGVPNAIKSAERVHPVLAAELKKYPGARCIVTGDMNHTADTPIHAALIGPAGSSTLLRDTFDYAAQPANQNWGTYHAFTGRAGERLPIDQILVSPGLKTTPAEIIRAHDPTTGAWPSDHFFVMTTIRAK